MARHIETAYDSNAPWETLGANVTKAKSVKGMMTLAGINWNVEKKPLAFFNDNCYHSFDRHYALVRDSDDSVLSIAGKDYVVTHHQDVFEFARPWAP